jgi:hypothetical protein
MSILDELVKQQKRAVATVEIGQVLKRKGTRAKLQTAKGGLLWAKCAIDAAAGQWITFARIRGEYQVLGTARGPAATVKTVRV